MEERKESFLSYIGRWTVFILINLVVLEVISLIIVAIFPGTVEKDHHQVRADIYDEVEWAIDYYDEFYDSNVSRWESYVYWRREAYEGEYISIDSVGIRTTTNSTCTDDNQIIYVMGGSTVWGTGVRNEFTIPSLLANQSSEIWGAPTCMINFGESGYVTTQDLFYLQRQLQAGNKPDVVIWYSGINDLFSAFQNGIGGSPQNEYNRELEFNITQLRGPKSGTLISIALNRAFGESNLIQLLEAFLAAVGPDRLGRPMNNPYSDSELKNLSLDTLERYKQNVLMAKSLSEEYGFEIHFIWQPSLYDKPNKSDFEKLKADEARPIEQMFSYLKPAFESEKENYPLNLVLDLSSALINEEEAIFLDWMHPGENGNAILADSIASHLKSLKVESD